MMKHEIDTKYDVKQQVWRLVQNKALNGEYVSRYRIEKLVVSHVDIELNGGMVPRVTYKCYDSVGNLTYTNDDESYASLEDVFKEIARREADR